MQYCDANNYSTAHTSDSLEQKTDQITDASLQSTIRMVKMCQETEIVKDKTLQQLHEQGEQIDGINDGIEKINSSLKESEKHLNGIEKWFGIIPLRKKKNSNNSDIGNAIKDYKKSTQQRSKSNASEKSVTSSKKAEQDRFGSSDSNHNGLFVPRINGDLREDEMEENLKLVSSMIDNIKEGSIEMGKEIDDQNIKLNTTLMESEKTHWRTESANKRTKNLL